MFWVAVMPTVVVAEDTEYFYYFIELEGPTLIDKAITSQQHISRLDSMKEKLNEPSETGVFHTIYDKLKATESALRVPSIYLTKEKQERSQDEALEKANRVMEEILGESSTDVVIEKRFHILWNGILVKIPKEKLSDDMLQALYFSERVNALTNLSFIDIFANTGWGASLNTPLQIIKVPEAWEKKDKYGRPLKGRGIWIGIVDTGIDYTHSAFADSEGPCTLERLKRNKCKRLIYVPDISEDDDDPMDGYYHGTAVANIAAGNPKRYKGVAIESRIAAFKVWKGGAIDRASVLEALERAVDLDGDGVPLEGLSDKVDVVNLSLGSAVTRGPYDALSRGAGKLMDAGVVVVAAAGNAGAFKGGCLKTFLLSKFTNYYGSSTGVKVIEPEITLLGYCRNSVVSPATSPKVISVGMSTVFGNIQEHSSRGYTKWEGGAIVKPDIVAVGGTPICAAKKKTPKGLIVPMISHYLNKLKTFMYAIKALYSASRALLKGDKDVGLLEKAYEDLGRARQHLAEIMAVNWMLRGAECGTDKNPYGLAILAYANRLFFKPLIKLPIGGWADIELLPPIIPAPSLVREAIDVHLAYNADYIKAIGTSFAAPQVAGAAALFLQAHPKCTPLEVKMALRNTAKDLKFDIREQGFGQLDVEKLVSLKRCPPVALLLPTGFPANKISNVVDIKGIAAGKNFQGYTLEIGRVGGGFKLSSNVSWKTLAVSSAPTPSEGGTLLENFDPRKFRQGSYMLKLTVINTYGDKSIDYMPIEIVKFDPESMPLSEEEQIRGIDTLPFIGKRKKKDKAEPSAEIGLLRLSKDKPFTATFVVETRDTKPKEIVIDYGDGIKEKIRERKVTHTYKYPGRYLVTLTAVDEQGNTYKELLTVDVKDSKKKEWKDCKETSDEAKAKYGLDRMLLSWELEKIDTMTCTDTDDRKGYFCDATQHTLDIIKSLAKFAELINTLKDSNKMPAALHDELEKDSPSIAKLGLLTRRTLKLPTINGRVYLFSDADGTQLLEAIRKPECNEEKLNITATSYSAQKVMDLVEECYKLPTDMESEALPEHVVLLLKKGRLLNTLTEEPQFADKLLTLDDSDYNAAISYTFFSTQQGESMLTGMAEEGDEIKIMLGIGPSTDVNYVSLIMANTPFDESLRELPDGFIRFLKYFPMRKSFLIKDGYGQGFIEAFTNAYRVAINDYMSKTGAKIDLQALQFLPTKVVPGVYNVLVDGSLRFSGRRISYENVKVLVRLDRGISQYDARYGTSYAKNPFFYIPFDYGVARFESNTPDERMEGYGSKITIESTHARTMKTVILNVDNQAIELMERPAGLVTLKVFIDERPQATTDGTLLRIDRKDGQFIMQYTPSVPVRLRLSSPGNEIYYGFMEDDRIFEKDQYGEVDNLFSWYINGKYHKSDVFLSASKVRPRKCSGWSGGHPAGYLELTGDRLKSLKTVAFFPLQSTLGIFCVTNPILVEARYYDPSIGMAKSATPAKAKPYQFFGGERPFITIDKIRYSLADILKEIEGENQRVCIEASNHTFLLRWNKERFFNLR
jgi:subtilisin family serine protease/PKD repeat protein